MNIGDKIKNARKSLGLSQQQLGGDEFTKGYISQIEKGRVTPSMKVLTLISERLNLPITFFLEEGNSNIAEIQQKFIAGQNLYLQKDYNTAALTFKNILDLGYNHKNSLYCISMLYLGKCLFFESKYEESLNILKAALSYINELSLYKEAVDCYKYIGDCTFNLNDYKAAINEYKKGFDLLESKQLNLPNIKAKLLLNSGTAYSNLGNFKTALEFFEKNISHCQGNYILDTLLDSFVRMGYCCYKLEMYAASKQHLSKALSINKTLNFGMAETEIYTILGAAMAKEGKVEAGFKFLSKSMEISKNIDYVNGYNINIVYWTSILIDADKLNEAEAFAFSYLKTLERAQDKLPLYLLQGNIGKLLIKKGNIDKSLSIIQASIKGLADINFYKDASDYSKLLADALITTNPEEAKKYYNLSIEYIQKTI